MSHTVTLFLLSPVANILLDLRSILEVRILLPCPMFISPALVAAYGS